ncbi:trypsin-like peptidase domain-containing protein [Bdellovibrionota bacterium FG-1]
MKASQAQKRLFIAISASVVLCLVALSHSSVHSAATEPPPPPLAATSLQNLFVDISDRLMPSVVNIFTTKAVRAHPHGFPGFPGFGGFPGDLPDGLEGGSEEALPLDPRSPQAPQTPMSLGTGFIIEAGHGKGIILTNHHVIAGADEVKVKFTESADEDEIPAKIIGKDPELDIAVLEVITDRKLQAVELGDSDRLKVGEWVAAIGNPFGHGHSVSHGIVSAKERTLPGGFGRYLQLDAPINPGNSGGPLVNMSGQVVGINNAIDARGPGIGFAIPINSIKEFLPQLKAEGKIDRGYLGINIMPLKMDLAKALHIEAPAGTPVVANVGPGTPAEKAGIEPYDVITGINGKTLKSTAQLVEAVLKIPAGQKILAQVIRGGKKFNFDVTVQARPQ